MWENTLIVYAGDNGGVNRGNNYPLRGEKGMNWEGAFRVAAFVSGGIVPESLRGTDSNLNTHVVDWYPTFSSLAGADPTDDPPVAPEPADVNEPRKNIYGDKSYPPVDGVDVWPLLMEPGKHSALDAAHKHLVVAKEVLIAGKYKLLVSQPYFETRESGWKSADGVWEKTNDDPCVSKNKGPDDSDLPVPAPGKTPCLYDLVADPSERKNIAADHQDVLEELWAALNLTIAGQRDCNGWSGPIKGPDGSCSPAEFIGTCDKTCAEEKWTAYGNPDGPIGGVPGCDSQLRIEV